MFGKNSARSEEVSDKKVVKDEFKLKRSPRFFGKSETAASARQLVDELNRIAIKVEENPVINAWDVSPVVPKGTRGTCAL